jgi:putative FmdB family regulatory protein
MPVYEYKCTKGHVFETIQRMSEDPLKKCEECGAPAERVLYAPAVHFKGKGFYNTDYGTKKRAREKASSKSSDSASSSSSSSSDSGSSTKSESKSDSKPKSDSGSSKPKPSSD